MKLGVEKMNGRV